MTLKNKRQSPLKNARQRVGKVFALASAVAGAELVLDGGVAEAEVITGDFGIMNETGNVNIIINTSGGGIAASAYMWASFPFRWSAYAANWALASVSNPGGAGGVINHFQDLDAGDAIDGALDFAENVRLPDNFDGYVGFRFDGAGSDVHYGWIRVTGNADGTEYSMTEWAYEDTPNTAIAAAATTSAVPEPSSLALLALGAAGLGCYRRRRDESEAGLAS